MDNINVPNFTKDNKMSSLPSPSQDCELALLGIEEKSPKSKRKIKRSSSKVWDHFTIIELVDPNNPRAECDYCGKDYPFDDLENGTSTLEDHISQCEKFPFRIEDKKHKVLTFEDKMDKTEVGEKYEVKKDDDKVDEKDEGGKDEDEEHENDEDKEDDDQSDGSSNIISVVINKEHCKKALAKMVIIDALPFGFVEGEGFRNFSRALCPDFDPPCKEEVARTVLQLYLEEKRRLRSNLIQNKQRVCLTVDTWGSIRNNSYICLTAHYIDDSWKLHKRILNFRQVLNHKGTTIGRMIETCLHEWGIEKVFTVTIDNASSNDGTISYIRDKLSKCNRCVLNGDFLHMRCCAQILNFIVKEGLSDLRKSITSIRNAVTYVRSCTSRIEKFKEYAEHEKIEGKALVYLDLSSSWNTTYFMLDSTLKFQKAFERMKEDDGDYHSYFHDCDDGEGNFGPSCDDWSNVRTFIKFLKLFYDASLKLSASLHLTSNLYFHELYNIHAQLVEWTKSNDYLLRDMAINMKRYYDKYWGSINNMNKLLYISVVLDPRYKMRYLSFAFKEVYDHSMVDLLIKGIRDALSQLYESYSASDNKGGKQDKTFQPAKDEIKRVTQQEIGVVRNPLLWKYVRYLKEHEGVEIVHEIERYLLEPFEDPIDLNFDVLQWWKLNSIRFRTLSQIARDVLAVPVAAISSPFNIEGRTVDTYRSSLPPLWVEALICGQNWFRSKSTTDDLDVDLCEYMDNMEIYEDIESEILHSCA